MTIQILSVKIPAWSTIGYGTGIDENGNIVKFMGDHREMRHIGEALQNWGEDAEPVMTELEDWQVSA